MRKMLESAAIFLAGIILFGVGVAAVAHTPFHLGGFWGTAFSAAWFLLMLLVMIGGMLLAGCGIAHLASRD